MKVRCVPVAHNHDMYMHARSIQQGSIFYIWGKFDCFRPIDSKTIQCEDLLLFKLQQWNLRSNKNKINRPNFLLEFTPKWVKWFGNFCLSKNFQSSSKFFSGWLHFFWSFQYFYRNSFFSPSISPFPCDFFLSIVCFRFHFCIYRPLWIVFKTQWNHILYIRI